MYYTGVVSACRKGMPSFPAYNKDMSRGEMKIYSRFRSPAASAVTSTAINVVKWIDSKAVHVITSANSFEKLILRTVKGKATKTPLPCPEVIKSYNAHYMVSPLGL